MPLNPSLERSREISVSSKPDCSTEQVSGQRRLHRETLSRETKQSNKITKQNKKTLETPDYYFLCSPLLMVRFTHPSAGSVHSSTCVPTSTEILPVIPRGPSLWIASPWKTLFMPGSSYLPALLHSCLLPLSRMNPDCFSYQKTLEFAQWGWNSCTGVPVQFCSDESRAHGHWAGVDQNSKNRGIHGLRVLPLVRKKMTKTSVKTRQASPAGAHSWC